MRGNEDEQERVLDEALEKNYAHRRITQSSVLSAAERFCRLKEDSDGPEKRKAGSSAEGKTSSGSYDIATSMAEYLEYEEMMEVSEKTIAIKREHSCKASGRGFSIPRRAETLRQIRG